MPFPKALLAPGAHAAAFTSMAMIAQQVAGKAARDALFLSNFSAASLPYVMAASAALSLGAILWLSRSLERRSPATLTPILFAVSAIALVAEWGIGRVSPALCAVAVYLHLGLFGPAVLTTFWSLINERFEPHTAKRVVAWIASGGTLGGVLGSLATWRASSSIEVPTLLLFLAGLNALCVVGSLLLRTHETPPINAPLDEPRSPVTEMRASPFLRNIALLVALGSAMSALLDYIFSARAAAAFPNPQALLAFFSFFWLAVTAFSFLLQIALGRIALEKLGLAVSMTVLPGVVAIGGVLGLLMPGLTSSAILRGAEAVQRNTMFRSAYELLYTPLLEARKRATKALIDIGFDRAGTVLGSGVLLLALHLAPAYAETILLALVVTIALATMPVTRRLHLGYVAALQEGLSAGAEKLEVPVEDPGEARVEIRGRDELIERIEGLDDQTRDGTASAALENAAAIISRGSDLLSGDVERARRALESWDSEKSVLASFAILLLAQKDLHLDALRALRRIASNVTGQLVDALVDPEMDFVVRRRIPRALGVCSTARAAGGLILGLHDARFEVRYECARALLRITATSEDVPIARDQVIASVLRELEPQPTAAELEIDEEVADDDPDSVAELLVEDRVDRRLQHVFTILSLHFEREPLRMAFRALHHGDVRHRGTALEYLVTILPSEVHQAVWPLLGGSSPLPAPRPAAEILADLILAGRLNDGAPN